MNRNTLTRVLPGLGLAIVSLVAAAQGYPGGGGGMPRQHGGGSIIPPSRPDTSAKRPETLRPHPMALFAAALEKESAALSLSPAAASAMQVFVRDMKDLAGLDDRRASERVGLMQPAAHATVDVARDLDATRESIRELGGAADDVASDWKKLLPLLDETQRRRVEAIYGNALLESRRVSPARN